MTTPNDPGPRGVEIRFDGVGHAYGDRPVLTDVDLTLTERRIGIVGVNGGGKSTLARMINGLVVPTSGTVTVDGLDTRRKGAQVRCSRPSASPGMPVIRAISSPGGRSSCSRWRPCW